MDRLDTNLDEWFDLATLSKSFCAHTPGHLARVAFDPGNDSMWVGALLGALIELLEHNSLLPGLPPLEDDSHLTRLVDFMQRLSKRIGIDVAEVLTANHSDEEGGIVSGHVILAVTVTALPPWGYLLNNWTGRGLTFRVFV